MNSNKWGFWSKFFIVLLIVLVIAGAATTKLTRYVHELAKNVVLDDDGYRVEITTYDNSVGELLNRYDITLGPGDEISPGLEELLQDNTEIKITRAMPVTVEADGKEEVTYVTRGRVQDILKKVNIVLREKDLINYPLSQQVRPYDRIKVTRMDEEVIIETEAIPYQVITRKNNQMDEGVSKVIQEGKQGELERRILVTYQDGVEIERKLISEEVTEKPVDRIVEKGTVKRIVTARGDTIRYSKSRKMIATAYTAGPESTGKYPGDRYYGVTSSGRKVKPHHTIAAPPDIPIGTKVYIPELVEFWAKRGVSISGIFTVEDRGGAIKGNKIDIYMEDVNMTRIWGRRKVTVYFIRK
ncbi:MAG TPA: DUF348 domain-containing protein [Clostridiales bacterium]|nr:DUF348 domain-containing protein [Clostridiales bacterium]